MIEIKNVTKKYGEKIALDFLDKLTDDEDFKKRVSKQSFI